MLLSFLFATDFNNILKLKLPSANKYFLAVFLFNFISFLYLIINPSDKYPELNSQIFFMQLYIFAILFALSTQSKNKVPINLDRYLFYISAFINLVILYQVTKGFTGLYLENVFFNELGGNNSMSQGGDKITMGRALYLSFITTIVYKCRNKIDLFIKPLLIISAFLGLYMFNTRSSIVICFISLILLYHWSSKEVNNPTLRIRQKLFWLFGLTLSIILVYFYISNDFLYNLVNIVVSNIKNGITSYFSNSSIDESASVRRISWKFFLSGFASSNLLQIIFGHGFISYFFDFPVLQAFFDLGILVFLIYLVTLIYLPIRFIIVAKSNNRSIIIIQLFALHYLFDQLYAGMPYWSFQFMPIILLCFFYKNNRQLFYDK